MFSRLIESAKVKLAEHQRAEEIKSLDLSPEEYVMVRDDKSPMALETLKAIIEKIEILNWDVDERTFRIVRASENSSTKSSWALAITSDTRRFHLKVFRDFDEELRDLDLGQSRGICSAIECVEQEIHRIREKKSREADALHQAMLLRERRQRDEELIQIERVVDLINRGRQNIYLKELSSSELGAQLIGLASYYIERRVLSMPDTQISFSIDDDPEKTMARFEGGRYKIIDGVPCELNDSKINVSAKFIINCINGKNLVWPRRQKTLFRSETRDFVTIDLPVSTDGSLERVALDIVQPRAYCNLLEPLERAESILAKIRIQDEITRGDVAKVELLGHKIEGRNLEDVRRHIDELLDSLFENVKLIIWNAKNPTD